MRILSLDHGTYSGFAVLDDGKLTSHGTFALSNSENKNIEFKLESMFNQTNNLLDIYKPDLYVAEYPSDRTNGVTTSCLIGFYSVGLLCATMKKIKTISARPTTVKKFITGYGFATKEEVAKGVCKMMNINIDSVRKPVYYRNTYKGHKSGDLRLYMYDATDAMANGFYVYKKCIKK